MKVSKQVKHEVRYTAPQQVVINNQFMEMPGQPYSVFVCPSCGNVLLQLQGEIPATKISEAMRNLMPDFRRFSFCPGCGEKLGYDVYEAIDGIVIEERTE